MATPYESSIDDVSLSVQQRTGQLNFHVLKMIF